MRKEKKISLLLSSGILVCIISSCIITDQSIFTSDSTYYETTAATEQNLIEVVMPKSLLDFSGVTAQDTADIFYDMINDPISYIAEDVSVNDDRSLSFYCTQLDIEQTIANFEFFVEDDYSTTGEFKVDGIVATGLEQNVVPGKPVNLRFKLTDDAYYFKGWKVKRT